LAELTLLLIDDEHDHADLITRALHRHDPAWRVEICNSCEEARQWLDKFTPTIVLSDLRLPDGDGLSLLKETVNPAFPTILMSAFGDEETAVKTIKAGAHDYIVKSENSFQSIGRVIDRCLREWQLNIDRQQAEHAQRQLGNQLLQAQKMESIGLLTGGIAHDFNNILASMLGFTELAMSQLQNGDLRQIESYLGKVRGAGEKARDLINQLLTYSRGGTRNPESLLLAPLIGEALRLLKPNVGTHITIHSEISANLPPVIHDRVQVQQLLMNLIINARDAIGDEPGEIRVSLTDELPPSLRCSSCGQSIDGPRLTLTVADNGPGIEDSLLQRIFEPFFTTKENGKGSGMGLAVVHGIAHESGGHLTVTRSPQLGGAAFALTFTPAPQQQRTKPEGKSIWIVDDNDEFAEYLQEVLQFEGYQTRVITDPLIALRALQETTDGPDLVITDMVMPQLSGVELIANIRQTRPTLPFILCSGYPGKLDQQDIQALNLVGLLDKPLDSLKLLEMLHEFFTQPATLSSIPQ